MSTHQHDIDYMADNADTFLAWHVMPLNTNVLVSL